MKKVILLSLFCSLLFSESLDELLEYAKNHSTAILQTKAQVKLAKEAKKASKAQNFGKLDLVGSYTHYNLPRTLAPLTPASILSNPYAVATTKDLFTTGVEYKVTLFSGFSQTKEIELSALQEKIANKMLHLTKEQLAYNIRSLYLNALMLQAKIKAQKNYIEALKQLDAIVAKEVELGKKAKIDRLKVQKEYYNAQSNLTSLQAKFTMTKASLEAVVGKKISQFEPLDFKVTAQTYNQEELFSKAVANNSQIAIEKLHYQKSQKRAQKAKASYYPVVLFDGYYGYNYGNNDSSNKYSGEFNSQDIWQAGVMLRWSIFDFGARDAKVEQAKIASLSSKLALKQKKDELYANITAAVAKIDAALKSYQAKQKEFELAKASEAIESSRYESGVATMNDLLLSKGQKALVESALLESKYNYIIAKFYLEYLLQKGSNHE